MFFLGSKAKVNRPQGWKLVNLSQMSAKKDTDKGFLLKKIESWVEKSSIQPHNKRKIVLAADLILNVFAVLIMVIVIRTYIMSPFQVYGISMCNTLNYFDNKCQDTYGDYLIINKSSYLQLPGWTIGTPQRGDIIVFRPPQNNGEYYIKRVIGLPGETVRLIDGAVYIYNQQFPEGLKLDEPYLNEENTGNTFPTGGIDEFKVPDQEYFVLGDNRRRSSDSRLCFKEGLGPGCEAKGITPYLKVSQIEGKAALAIWPRPRIITTADYPQLKK